MPTLNYPIRVPSDVLEALGEFTGHCWSDSLSLEPFICAAIRNYVRPAPAAQTQPTAASRAGYQWKQVFLPEGTRLRACFGGHHYFAQVEGGEIKYGEHAMSPSRFANLQGSGNRNAWKALWLCLPGSEEWLLADVCRSARKAAIARLLGGSAHAERPPPERERRVAERRTARGAANGKRFCDLRQPAVRESGPYQSGPCQSEPSAPGGPVALIAKNSNGFQRKGGTGRDGRRKRRAMNRLPGYP
jgi:hypothetical protein